MFVRILFIAFALAGVGCATTSALRAEQRMPAWTQIASCEQDGDRVRAVGVAQKIQNVALARMAAATRARAALVRCLHGAEERVERRGGSVVRMTYTAGLLTGATIDEYYVDPTSRETYALASVAKRGISPTASLATATK